ncbi:hypothetical protein [Rhizobium rhizogenes]|uniref:hypothetical protein n=1 Tax=Rhizobium rhizogenes TaxID=359 RepID=UPI001572E531|nr:hypothetical protein [Rhizobium rhizogenes]NTI22403.1 hypothetical protein [Rhizobium rhizogenes]
MKLIDPKNPPAVVVLIDEGKTKPWVQPCSLRSAREDVTFGMRRHLSDPEFFARPMCIVKLKAWK